MCLTLDDLKGPECKVCGASLEGKRADAVFCSYKCFMADYELIRRAATREAKQGRTCGFCKAPMSVEMTAKAIYCSESCQQKARYYRIKSAPCVCKTCGSAFLGRLPSDKYCSPACRRAEGLRVRSLSWKPKMTCERCGTPFAQRPNGKHCSQKCRMLANAERRAKVMAGSRNDT